ncbi:hypothetical protein [Bradyrhizobium sp. WU425]|uniref:hypothetical protein n=1 Tax=Bradyrhizobium sp. WU425 TaxID=187029 RepID=UPI001E4DBB6C|nr:hypothetical protein [Bradyrhizobium canariense]UFW75178.1 hypothetical protein BcanWU425_15980 [Bradyrhizobium canariense]
MVAYSYKARFVAPIRVGLGLPVLDLYYELGGYLPGQPIRPKRQTIRANGRRRHARPGETLQLYYAMRTTKCFKVGDGRCKSVHAIRVFVHGDRIVINPDCDHEIVYSARLNAKHLDGFAAKDGFDDWAAMRTFWLEEHDGKRLGPFVGVLIKWEPL